MDKIRHRLTYIFILEESITYNSTRDKLLNDCLIIYFDKDIFDNVKIFFVKRKGLLILFLNIQMDEKYLFRHNSKQNYLVTYK